MITVRELLGDLDVRLRSGEAALDVPVRWVHISELKDPTPWLSGGELLLTTGLQLTSPQRQRDFVHRLADHRLAGLGFGTGFGHDDVPAALLQAAAERDFPVFEVSYDTPFIAVTEAAFTRLVNEQYAVLRRALAAHERLENVVLAERGLGALAGTLSTLLGAAVLVLDARGAPLATHEFRRTLEPTVVGALQTAVQARRTLTEPPRPFLPDDPEIAERGLVLPVTIETSPGQRVAEAWLVAVKDDGALSDFDRLTVHQAVTIVALELLRDRVAGDTERRLAGDVLSGIVSGELSGAELERRLRPFGLGESLAAIVVPRGELSPSVVERAVGETLRTGAVPGLLATSGPLTCVLAAGGDEPELLALAQALADRLQAAHDAGSRPEQDPSAAVRVGLGRPVVPSQARRSFHEARCAVEAVAFAVHGDPAHHGHGATNGHGSGNGNGHAIDGDHARPGPQVATYRDLGSFQLLLSLQEEEALRLFCDSILGPIEAGDGHYGGELMRSLEAFIEENGQWERAAKRLYCHRHTLRYRIRRVEELTGRSLGSARDRIEFWLALRGRELVA